MCEVSTSWKFMIESDKYLMNRAMDGVVLELTNHSKEISDEDEEPLIDASENILKKDYDVYQHFHQNQAITKGFKHITIENIALVQPSTVLLYSHCLVSLKVESVFEFDSSDIPGCTFEKLQTLEIIYTKNDWTEWLLKCQFPSVNDLKISESFYDENHDEKFKTLKLLLLMPMLKHLKLNHEYSMHPGDYLVLNQAASSLEGLELSRFHHDIIRKHESFLKRLKVESMTLNNFSYILQNCGNLEQLLLKEMTENLEDFNPLEAPAHHNIATLDVGEMQEETLRLILNLLPNLETLIISVENCQPSDIIFFGNSFSFYSQEVFNPYILFYFLNFQLTT